MTASINRNRMRWLETVPAGEANNRSSGAANAFVRDAHTLPGAPGAYAPAHVTNVVSGTRRASCSPASALTKPIIQSLFLSLTQFKLHPTSLLYARNLPVDATRTLAACVIGGKIKNHLILPTVWRHYRRLHRPTSTYTHTRTLLAWNRNDSNSHQHTHHDSCYGSIWVSS